MPFQTVWTDPELFLEQDGVQVFHTYKNDDLDQGQQRYWYTLHRECSPLDSRCAQEPCRHVFDVRVLSTWQPPVPAPACGGGNDTTEHHAAWEQQEAREEQAIRGALRRAIEQKELTAGGVRDTSVSLQ